MPLLDVVLTLNNFSLAEFKIPKQIEGNCAGALEVASYTGETPSKAAETELERRELI